MLNDGVPTINDVARLAGVSKRTVSRVLNNSDKVNAATRKKIQDVIDELNFIPSSQARGLAANRSYLLGLIYDVPTLFTNAVQKGIASVCSDAGYDIVVHPCEYGSPNLVSDVRRFVTRSKVDGVIMLPPVSEIPELAAALDKLGVPHVRFSSDLSAEPWRLVVTNYEPAIADMTHHLVKLGHRDIGFISGPAGSIPSEKRQKAFTDALARHDLGLEDRFMACGAFTYDTGAAAARELFGRAVRPTAIFAANDEMAFSVLSVANELGIAVPDDLSVVGFDGTRFSSFVVPSLSTIRRPTLEMASLGARKLLAFINDGVEAARAFESMVSPQFVPRQSTGPVPKAKARPK
ncbi:MAG: LacI family DNA-binding transcriptional regulator [Gammaproteobacteria bacterium]